MTAFHKTLFSLLAVCLTLGAPVSAQDLTEAEIRERLQRQILLGQTRGLKVPEPAAPSTQATEAGYVRQEAENEVSLRINFDLDSWELRPDQAARLTAMCNAMRSLDAQAFQIIGHTDAIGDAGYNRDLSLKRAEAVRDHLVRDCGLSAAKLRVLGLGEEALLDAQNPRAGVNRRVEFQAQG